MRATGIVRRVDELGRVVIPKEIRRTLRIREGDPLEIFTDQDGNVIFKKYSPLDLDEPAIKMLIEGIYKKVAGKVFLIDRDEIQLSYGIKRQGLSLSQEVYNLLDKNRAIQHTTKEVTLISGQPSEEIHFFPILSDCELIGGILVASTGLTSGQAALAIFAAETIGRILEG